MTPKYNVKCKLSGTDGNAFALMVEVVKALRKAKASPDDIRMFREQAMSGDYPHLLRTCSEWVEVR